MWDINSSWILAVLMVELAFVRDFWMEINFEYCVFDGG